MLISASMIFAISYGSLDSPSERAAAIICSIKSGIEEMLNLQRDGNKAKPYQVRQVRSVLLRHGLGVED
jgi:hypothetical protein